MKIAKLSALPHHLAILSPIGPIRPIRAASAAASRLHRRKGFTRWWLAQAMKNSALFFVYFVYFVIALSAAHRLPRKSPIADSQSPMVPGPYATNAFSYEDSGVRIFSVDWAGLTPGCTYEVQSSTDAKSWRHRTTLLWTDPDPAAYWRTQFPTLPPAPFHTAEVFRLREAP
jgi:hypothetical protein